MTSKLTVFFEDPFWVGIFEKETPEGYIVAREVFGSEPTDLEVFHFILTRYQSVCFSKPNQEFSLQIKNIEDVNPKRLQRMAAKEMKSRISIKKAYEAVKTEHEKRKQERKTVSKQEKEEAEKRKFELRQMKKKEKHKGH